MIRIFSLTDKAFLLAEKIQAGLKKQRQSSELLHKPKAFSKLVQDAFVKGDRLIMICAMGIAVRVLAPVLKNKHQDPAVLVLDEQGQFVIPLLSGHEGGANQWAQDLSSILKAQLVLTTAAHYLNPVYTVGMGCERHCSQAELASLLKACLNQADLKADEIYSVNSIAIKSDEQGLIDLSADLQRPFYTWDVPTLRGVESQLSQRSDYVFKVVGVYGVAESAALIGAQQETGERAELMLSKQKSAVATCAIARSFPQTQIKSSDD